MERNKVDSLKVIAAHNIARLAKNKGDVEGLEIPWTVQQSFVGFVNKDTDDDIDDKDDDTDNNDDSMVTDDDDK